MSKRSILTALALIAVGIIVGAVLVSNLSNGVDIGFARGGDVQLGGPVPVASQTQTARGLGDNFVAVARAVTPSVVAITVTTSGKPGKGRTMPRDFWHFFAPDGSRPDPEPTQGFGSGVIVTADGYIVTNNHVVEEADKNGIEVVLHDKIRYKAVLIGTDPSTDLAVVKIDAKDLTAAALGNSDKAQVGEWVLAIGNPLGLTSTVTAGIISATGRSVGIIQGNYGIENFIQTDAAINPGNSGGALVNMNGEVIGINSAIATTNARYQGYGFAVPVNLLKGVAADLIKSGKVNRGYIGVKIGLVDQTMANAVGLSEPKGVLVNEVVKDGAAETAGLRAGDVILSIDGKEVNMPNELQTYVAQHHPGDAVMVSVYREGKTIEKKVVLRPREEEPIADERPEPAKDDNGTEDESLKAQQLGHVGMTVRALTPDERKSLGIESGVVVADVQQYGEAFNRFIRPNDVIVEADRKPVRSPAELKKLFDGKRPGDAVLLRLKRQGDGGTAFAAVQIPK